MKTDTRLTTLRAAALVIVAGSACASATAGGLGSEPLESFDFYGVLRDFSSSHPDFGLDSTDAPGQYAGNIQFFADGDFKPVYLGTGAEVSKQWLDKAGNPIAPHLYDFGGYAPFPEGTGTYATGTISMGQATLIDSWNSAEGTYAKTQSDDALIGIQSTSTGAITMTNDAAIGGSVLVGPGGDPNQVMTMGKSNTMTGTGGNLTTAPDPMQVRVPNFGASVGDIDISTNTTITSKRFECDNFTLGNTRTLKIEGAVEIVVHGTLTIGQSTKIELGSGATLRFYTLSTVEAVEQDALVNVNTQDPSRVTFFHISSSPFTVSQGTIMYATIYAPDAPVYIVNAAEVYGRVLCDSLALSQGGKIHIDEGLIAPRDACNVTVADVPGAYSAAHNGAVDSELTYRQWFRTLPNINVSQLEAITLQNDGAGVYEFEAADFTIADNELLGNEGDTHNRNFTMEFGAICQYDMCKGQFFEFEGDGDAWLLINDQLVIDLAGFGKGKLQFADLDRLGMYDGELYVLRFFYAQRTKDGASAFKIRTNANLLYSRGVIPESSGLYD